jgi:cytochrome c oxidase cbb3-type subunit 4
MTLAALTYETVAGITQVAALLMFVAMFIGVVAYALWPRNRARFEEAQRRALGLDPAGEEKSST